MKKVLAIGLVSLALAQAKVFIGVQASYDWGASIGKTNTFNTPIWSGNVTDGWGVGANFGLEQDFGYFGLREFLSFDYSSSFLDKATGFYGFDVFDLDLNLDALINFVKGDMFSMGMFLGAGVGYQYMSFFNNTGNNNKVKFSFGNLPLFARAGLTFGIGSHSRIDLGLKIPLIAFGLHKGSNGGAAAGGNGDEQYYYPPLKIQLSYKFLF